MVDSQAAAPTQLPANPNITHLKKQAKDLKKAVDRGERAAVEVVRSFHPGGDAFVPGAFTLRDAQLTLARRYGFEGWHQLSTTVGELMVEQRDMHRWFGVHLNNGMWDRIDDGSIGPQLDRTEREDLLYSAYASAYHWRQVGNEANQARGEHLISRMAVCLGEHDVALLHALRCLELVEANRPVMEDWDVAFAHEAVARALAAVGELDRAAAHRERAIDLTGSLQDEEDRSILEAELSRQPWFGLT